MSLVGAEGVRFGKYARDPEGFFVDVLGVPEDRISPHERKWLKSLVKKKRVAIATCNGAGKTTFAAKVVCWFLNTRKNARVITTAGVGAQVRLLWRKIRATAKTAKRILMGEPMTTEWNVDPEWFAIGIATDEETNLQGYHALDPDDPGAIGLEGMDAEEYGGLLAVIEEASGVKPWVFAAMRGYMTSGQCYWLVQGNPNYSDGEFAEIFRRGGKFWDLHHIAAFDVPWISKQWIEEQREYWGEDSPQWAVRVLGQFPKHGGDYQVFPISYFEGNSQIRPKTGGIHIGCDVARGNADRNTNVVTKNNRVIFGEAFRSNDTMYIAQRVNKLREKYGCPDQNVHVDVNGVGAGVADRLREAGHTPDMVNFGEGCAFDQGDLFPRELKFYNRRAELYWAAREHMRRGTASVPSRFRDTIWREAQTAIYDPDDDRRGILIEPKKKMKEKLLGASPDWLDAWVMTFSRAGAGAQAFVIEG